MRVIMIIALAGRCAATGRAEGLLPTATGIYGTSEDSGETPEDLPRLDLGAWEPLSTGDETTSSSSSGEGSTSTPTTSSGETAEAGTSTSAGSTSTGDGSTSAGGSTSTSPDTSTGGESTTGEPLTDCPCEDGADNVCDLPPGTCSATLPGGYCDPNGDGFYGDGDYALGLQEYAAKCG